MTHDTYVVVIPAAGIGQRCSGDLPKQYQLCAGKPVIQHSIDLFLQQNECQQVMVVLNEKDKHWGQLNLTHPKLKTTIGGETRAASVQSGLNKIADICDNNTWVMVHDAARPCLHQQDLQKLWKMLQDDEVGGLLVSPIFDTVKLSSNAKTIDKTLDRGQLYLAQTPQMFRFHHLQQTFKAANLVVTDEAGMIESLGLMPRLVLSDFFNEKVTTSQDLKIAEIVQKRGQRC